MYCTGVLLIGSPSIALATEVTAMGVGARPPKGPLGTLPGLEISGIAEDLTGIVTAVVTVAGELTNSISDPELSTTPRESAVCDLLTVGIPPVNWSLVALEPRVVASSAITAVELGVMRWGRMNGVALTRRLLGVTSQELQVMLISTVNEVAARGSVQTTVEPTSLSN